MATVKALQRTLIAVNQYGSGTSPWHVSLYGGSIWIFRGDTTLKRVDNLKDAYIYLKGVKDAYIYLKLEAFEATAEQKAS
jgi:hypothetical protein